MKYLITESQVNSLIKPIQTAINFALDGIREDSEEWGMGEMDELHEIGAIKKIIVDRIEKDKRLMVYVNIYINYARHEFENTLHEIQFRIKSHFPRIKLIENEIIDERTFGPGIDW